MRSSWASQTAGSEPFPTSRRTSARHGYDRKVRDHSDYHRHNANRQMPDDVNERIIEWLSATVGSRCRADVVLQMRRFPSHPNRATVDGPMATLVCFHAHPDDESLTTGGVIAKYSAAGHRVVIVTATGGEHGEVPDDLASGETLADRRRSELEASARVLGVQRVVMLGYEDSGMTGWEQNRNPAAFANADLEEAAARLAAVLREEGASTLTVYDWHGNYGHPDHVQVHRVGHRAAELAETPFVYEATINRDAVRRMIEAAAAMGMDTDDFDADGPADDGNPMGTPEAELTTAVDVSAFVAHKRQSFACHASQAGDVAFFLEMPGEAFAMMTGVEWFIRRGAPPGIHESELAGLE